MQDCMQPCILDALKATGAVPHHTARVTLISLPMLLQLGKGFRWSASILAAIRSAMIPTSMQPQQAAGQLDARPLVVPRVSKSTRGNVGDGEGQVG